MSATQIRTFQKLTMTKLKMKSLSKVSHYNINLPMAIFTSTNNISPNSSESFYIDLPSPPLISMATSLRFPQGRLYGIGQPSSVMLNKCLQGGGGGGGGRKLTKPFWPDTSSRLSRTLRSQNTTSGYIEERASKRFFTLKIGAVNGLHEISACLRIKINNNKKFTWRHPRLSLGSTVLKCPGLFKG